MSVSVHPGATQFTANRYVATANRYGCARTPASRSERHSLVVTQGCPPRRGCALRSPGAANWLNGRRAAGSPETGTSLCHGASYESTVTSGGTTRTARPTHRLPVRFGCEWCSVRSLNSTACPARIGTETASLGVVGGGVGADDEVGGELLVAAEADVWHGGAVRA